MHRRAALLSAFLAALAASSAAEVMVWNVSGIGITPSYTSNLTIEGSGSVGGYQAAQVRFEGQWSQYGSVFAGPVNWSSFTGFTFTVQNLEGREVALGIRFDRNSTYSSYVSAGFTLAPYETRRFYLDLSGFNAQGWGLATPMPVISGLYTLLYPYQTGLTLDSVYRWQVYSKDGSPIRAKVTSLYGESGNYSVTNLVDRYGQFTRRTWGGKVTSVQDMRDQAADEDADLAANPGNGELLGSTQFLGTPTGKWRITKGKNGAYYFVTPQGRFFWSLGVVAVTDDAQTITTGRPAMFMDLPTLGDPRAAFYGSIVRGGQTKTTYSHYKGNLLEKYGASWLPAWASRSARRLKSWNLNTIGAGSHMAVRTNTQMSFTASVSTDAFPTRISTPSAYWRNVPDPFHPDFGAWTAAQFAEQLATVRGDSRLLGVYVDGEHVWGIRGADLRRRYEIPLAVLQSGGTLPAKGAFVTRLQWRYSTIQALNTAWGTALASWTTFKANPLSLNDIQLARAQADLSNFAFDFGKAFFWRVERALASAAPGVLFLGSRESIGWCPDEYFQAQGMYVDVISIDQYSDVSHTPWTFIASLPKPVLVAEFSFTGRDFNGFPNTVLPDCERPDQAQRAAAARTFLDRALATKNVVGAHWYRYNDFPISGKAEHDQNYAFGLLDVTDNPYQPMIEMLRGFGRTMYATRGR